MIDYQDVQDDVNEGVADTVVEAATGEIPPEMTFSDWIQLKISLFATIPAFLFVLAIAERVRIVPLHTGWKLALIAIGVLALTFIVVTCIVAVSRYLIYFVLFFLLITLTINTFKGKNYGFRDLRDDYAGLVFRLFNRLNPATQEQLESGKEVWDRHNKVQELKQAFFPKQHKMRVQ